MTEDAKIALCRLVGVLLLTDGHLTDTEYEHFHALMERLEVGSKRGKITGSIGIDTDIEPLVAAVKASGGGDELLEALETASTVDGDRSAPERDIIERVRGLLG